MYLSPHGTALVLWLHVLAACIWIGGQITLGTLVSLLREQPDVLRAAARRFQWIAWAAFLVLVVTGIANVHNAGIAWDRLNGDPRGRTLSLKLVFVLLSGLAAGLHAFVVGPRASRRPTPALRAWSGGLGAASRLAAVIAALYGVIIAES
jgi:uncharacterized membrane protein